MAWETSFGATGDETNQQDPHRLQGLISHVFVGLSDGEDQFLSNGILIAESDNPVQFAALDRLESRNVGSPQRYR